MRIRYNKSIKAEVYLLEVDPMRTRKQYVLLISFIVITLTLIFTVPGCSLAGKLFEKPPAENNPVQVLWDEAPEGTIAVLINQPTIEQKADFKPTERLVLEDSGEGFLLIPAEKVEEITIWSLEFNGSDFVRKKDVYKNLDPDDEYILDLTVMRPEGGPHYEISVVSDGGEASYYIAYNGKEGNPNIEYIKAD